MLASHSCFCSFFTIHYQNICKMFLFTSNNDDDDEEFLRINSRAVLDSLILPPDETLQCVSCITTNK